MTRLADELGGFALELATSLWSELGVDGTIRSHDRQAIDLEALILFTAWIGASDRNLRTRSIEWSIANFRLASAIRMRNLAQRASPSTRQSLGRFAATVNAHTNAPWPAQGKPLALLPTMPTEPPDLRRPSLLQLRLRALVGVSARAEILRLLLAEPNRPRAAAQLAEGAAYGKGTVAQALEMLAMTGIVQMEPSGNRILYRLSRPADLRLALQWVPVAFPDWPPIFRITESLVGYARSAPPSASARLTRLRTLLHYINDDVQRLGMAEVVPKASSPASIPEFDDWAKTFVADQSGSTEMRQGANDVTYVVHHLSYGGWVGTVLARGRQPGQLEAPARVSERGLEEQSGPRDLAQAVFDDMLGRDHRASSEAREVAALRTISREFTDELLRPIEGGQQATFTAEFVRRWFENRRRRLVTSP
jgi:DNA-binding transcriptional ArsR family regulator